MNENQFILIAVSHHKGADDFFKKFKREVDQAAKGSAHVMRAVLPDNGEVMVQVYPTQQVYTNLSGEETQAIVNTLFSQSDEAKALSQAPSAYIDDLAALLRLNMQATEANICGKCSPCRIGGPLINELLGFYQGEAVNNLKTPQIVKELDNVGFTMKNASMCAIGMFGADPLLFAMSKWPNYFNQA